MRNSDKSRRISVRLTSKMDHSLRRRSALTGQPESSIVREAIENHLAQSAPYPSALAVARRLGLVGCAKDLPADLSTNPDYFDGFGTRA